MGSMYLLMISLLVNRHNLDLEVFMLFRSTLTERQKFWSEVMLDPEQEMQHRLKAAELLGKSECDFSERLQIDGSVEVTVGFLFDPAQRRALLAEVQDVEYEALPSESS